MPLVRNRSVAQLTFALADGDISRFQVVRYRGQDGLCQLYRFEIELLTTDTQVAFDDIVGKAAVLSVNTDTEERWFHGLVSRFELVNQSTDLLHFRAELVPDLWLLTHRYGSRIFQNKSVEEIVTQVLTDAGFPSDRFEFSLEGTYPAREYCVQYRESDYNFIARLLEEEGIWWRFEQSKEGHKLILADSNSGYQALPGDSSTLPFVPPGGLTSATEHVYRFRFQQAVRPGAVVLKDYTFKNPQMALRAAADAGRDAGLEYYDFPGEYTEESQGTAYAKKRVEEFEAGRILGVGQSNSYRLKPAAQFSLSDHPISGIDGNYVITSIVHEGKQATLRTPGNAEGQGLLDPRMQQCVLTARNSTDENVRQLADALLQINARLRGGDPTANRALTHWIYHAGQVSRDLASVAAASGMHTLDAISLRNLIEETSRSSLVDRDASIYECTFACIPASATYRPPRVTPWPIMRGTQTARVVGPDGEEIHADKYGRVRVQFHWDREGGFGEQASCWIRVAQGMAGGGYGMLFLPRIGQEVIVDFLEGDPDQPIIIGRVYNADHMPAYPLPAEKTKSYIKTRSSKEGGGSNEIRFEDLKDHEQILVYGQKDIHIRAQNQRVESVGADAHLSVGKDRFEEVKGHYHLKVKDGSKNEEIGLDLSLNVKGKSSVKVTSTYSLDVGSDVVEKFGANHKHDVATTYALKATSIKLEAASGIEIKCGGSTIVLTPSGIYIVGSMVYINSGAGPSVSPVSASPTAPKAPEPAGAADTVQHGQDTRYGGTAPLPGTLTLEEAPGQEWEDEEEKTPSWIEIELVDEADQPVAGERYKITGPDGKAVREGSTDATGSAHIDVPEAGSCKISFPNLDSAAWERI